MVKYISKNTAFHSCISNAKTCNTEEAAEYYRLAIMVDPVAEEGYLGLISCLKDGTGSRKAPDSLLEEILYASEYGRRISNIENLRINPEGYEKVVQAAAGMTGCLKKDQKTAAP